MIPRTRAEQRAAGLDPFFNRYIAWKRFGNALALPFIHALRFLGGKRARKTTH